MKIHSVAVLGAGAVGSYVIWGLSEKKDISLSVIAKGERAERLKAEGCLINGKTYHPEVLTPEEAKGVRILINNTYSSESSFSHCKPDNCRV